jgi:nucleoid-associated protein
MNDLSAVEAGVTEAVADGAIAFQAQFQVVAAITASMERDTNVVGNPFKFSLGNLWNLNSKAANGFIEQIEKKFRRKNKFHSYFSGLPSNSTPINIEKYISSKTDFQKLAEAQMSLIVYVANSSERGSLQGGNLVFVHYKTPGDDDDVGRLMIVMVDKKSAFEFDKYLQPKALQPIDTDALRQAAMFDLTLFTAVYPNKEGATYLHFIEGRSKSDFFKTALGCDSTIPNKESIYNLFEAIKLFSLHNDLKPVSQERLTQGVYDFLDKHIGKQVSLGDIQHIVDKHLPDGHKAAGAFSEFANDQGFQINDFFEATRASLNNGVSIKIIDFESNYSVSVKSGSLGYEGSDKPVIVDDNLTYLMIPLSASDREKIRVVVGEKDGKDEIPS